MPEAHRMGTRSVSLALCAWIAAVGAMRPAVLPRLQSSITRGPAVAVTVDARHEHQRIEGFGATYISLADGDADSLSADLRRRALAAAFQDVRLTTGLLDGPVLEMGPDGVPRNDDDDPNHFNWQGFRTARATTIKRVLLDRPEAASLGTLVWGQRINVRWGSPWLGDLRRRDFSRFLDEAAEQVAAGLVYWRDTLRVTPKYVLLFNEPTTGNRELNGGTIRDVVELVKRVGLRLRREGFSSVKFVVPNEESEAASLETARAILSDAEARQFVGAIGYHPYPWGSPYVSIPRLLAAADLGRVNAERRSLRHDLRDLANRYRLPLWMTEVSHGEVDARSFDDLRGRAIHIHDELEYADAAAYFGMVGIWDLQTHRLHYGNTDGFWNEEGTVVLVDQSTNTVRITGMGYAIGHYARWLHAGAVRLEVRSGDPLILVSGFRDDTTHRFVAVMINDAPEDRTLRIETTGLRISGEVSGERSTAAASWMPITATAPSGDILTVQVPAKSVTTIAVSAEPERSTSER